MNTGQIILLLAAAVLLGAFFGSVGLLVPKDAVTPLALFSGVLGWTGSALK